MQTLLRDPAAGVMHSFIYFGFIVLFVATVVLEVDHQLPESLKFLHGRTYQAYAATADVFGVVFVLGIVWAIGRRYIQRPYRIRIKTKPEDAVILGDVPDHRPDRLLHRGVPHRRGRSARSSRSGRSSATRCRVCSTRSRTSTLESAHRWLWGVHFAAFVGFLMCCPPRSSGT